MRDNQENAGAPNEYANLVALAQRLRPNTGTPKPGERRD
jgi:hypothetical protein